MNEQVDYVWHRGIRVVNEFDLDRTVALYLPVDVSPPSEVTPDTMNQLYPGGYEVWTGYWLGQLVGRFAAPIGIDRDYASELFEQPAPTQAGMF